MQEKTLKKLSPDELQNVLNDHRRWLESEGTHGRKADLRCCDLSNRNLFGVDLRMSVLRDIDFSRTNLRTANLKQADLHSCRFHQADFQHRFQRRQARKCKFPRCQYRPEIFTNSKLARMHVRLTDRCRAGIED